MKIITWNINGFVSTTKSGHLQDLIKDQTPDIVCLQEIKINNKVDMNISDEYNVYTNYDPNRPGYSGTAIMYKKNIDINKFRKNKTEGRLISMEFDDMVLINVYVPNSGDKLKRLDYRVNDWDVKFKKFLQDVEKPIIVVGDMNVARTELDLKNPKTNKKTAGFTKEERASFEDLLKTCKLRDVWREMHPTKEEYTFWSYFRDARARNIGWRLDYVLTNLKQTKKMTCKILREVYGSDHAPVLFEM